MHDAWPASLPERTVRKVDIKERKEQCVAALRKIICSRGHQALCGGCGPELISTEDDLRKSVVCLARVYRFEGDLRWLRPE